MPRRRVELGQEGTARVVAVADTHGRPHEGALARIEALAPDLIVHAGDVGDLAVLDRLAAIAPVQAVRGNIDASSTGLPEHLLLELGRGEATPATLLLTHIALHGPNLRAEVHRLAEREGASLVVCGHSHVPFLGRCRGLPVFNPGSIGPRRFALPIVFGLIELGPSAIELSHRSAETGEPWSPGAPQAAPPQAPMRSPR